MTISIHAPARGATIHFRYVLCISLFQSTLPRGERRRKQCTGNQHILFQSTLPRGERPELQINLFVSFGFQSTLPRGERLMVLHFHSIFINFNPRSREGSDIVSVDANTLRVISIHAPARGATCASSLSCSIAIYFNPRSREGSDRNPGVCLSSGT